MLANIKDTAGNDVWQRPLDMPAIVARHLTDSEARLSLGINLLNVREHRYLNQSGEMLAAYLMANHKSNMQIVPLLGYTSSL